MKKAALVLASTLGVLLAVATSAHATCPQPLQLVWAFGEVEAGSTIQVSRNMPSALVANLAAPGYVGYERTSSSLPTDARFDLIAPIGIGTLEGALQTGTIYVVEYAFLDDAGCPLAELTIVIDAGDVSGTDSSTTTETACSRISAILRTPAFLFIPETTTEISVGVSVDGGGAQASPFEICGTPGQELTLAADTEYSTTGASFVRWERQSGSGGSWTEYSPASFISVAVDDQYAYRAVYESLTGLEVTTEAGVCLTVRAGYGANPLPVTLLVNGTEEMTALFELCGPVGTQQTLTAPDAHRGDGKVSDFLHWERYNKQAKKWFQYSGANTVTLTVQEKGQIRAVYTSPRPDLTFDASPPSGLGDLTFEEELTITTSPGILGGWTTDSPCIEVSAVFQLPAAYSKETTKDGKPAKYDLDPVYIAFAQSPSDSPDDDTWRDTPCYICDDADATYRIYTPSSVSRADGKLTYSFQFWEWYDEETETWQTYIEPYSNTRRFDIGSGLKVRLVYERDGEPSDW